MLKFQHGLLFVMKRLMWSYRHNPMSEKTEGAAKPRKVGLLHGAAEFNALTPSGCTSVHPYNSDGNLIFATPSNQKKATRPDIKKPQRRSPGPPAPLRRFLYPSASEDAAAPESSVAYRCSPQHAPPPESETSGTSCHPQADAVARRAFIRSLPRSGAPDLCPAAYAAGYKQIAHPALLVLDYLTSIRISTLHDERTLPNRRSFSIRQRCGLSRRRGRRGRCGGWRPRQRLRTRAIPR